MSDIIKLVIVDWNGHSNHCVYLDDYRIAGGKPWAGGRVSKEFNVRREDVLRALQVVDK